MAKLSVDKALFKAKSHAKKGEIEEAQKLYQSVLQVFPKNKRAQQGLAALNKPKRTAATQGPPQDTINQLLNLYNQGQLAAVVDHAQVLTDKYAEAFIVWNILGAANKGLGRVGEALVAFKKATELNPNYADGFNNLGIILHELGRQDEAIEAYTKAFTIKPDFAQAYNNIGITFENQIKLGEAIEAYNKALLLKPDYAEANFNIGNAFQKQGKLGEAIEAYSKALSLNPNYADTYYNMGTIFQDQGRQDEAIEAYNKALLLKPDYADTYYNMGTIFQNQGKLNEAIEAFEKALSLKPDYADAYNNLGVALQDQGKLDEAIESYEKALSLKPDYAEAYNNIGNTLKDQGKLDEAIELFKKALSIKPEYAEAYSNMGNVLKAKGNLEEAIVSFNKALSFKPEYADAHVNLSYAFLSSGRLKEGLDEYEWRWKNSRGLLVSGWRQFSQPLWDGQKSLKGKSILLWCEQGVGDTISWSSCVKFVASQADHCVLECQEKLVPLLTRSFPNVEVKAENRNSDLVRDDFDVHLPMGSLYKQFLSKVSQNAKVDAFLVPNPVRVNFWRERLISLGNGPYVGISWKSTKMSLERMPNYALISELSPVLSVPEVTFINLQPKDFKGDLSKIQNEFGVTVHNFDDLDHYDNLDEVAALSSALDMVVSIQSTVPLLAAGVGTHTKLACWRQSSWNNILHKPIGAKVDKFERNTWEPWINVFSLIAKDIALSTDSYIIDYPHN